MAPHHPIPRQQGVLTLISPRLPKVRFCPAELSTTLNSKLSTLSEVHGTLEWVSSCLMND